MGSAPGVIIGAVLRVYVADDPTVFKLIAAAVLLPTGMFILRSTRRTGTRLRMPLSPRAISLAAFVVGIVGGIYGIGGGSILGPILVGSGMAVSVVAPAALASTFVTSIVGVLTFAVPPAQRIGLHLAGLVARDRLRSRRPLWRLPRRLPATPSARATAADPAGAAGYQRCPGLRAAGRHLRSTLSCRCRCCSCR